MLREFFLDCKWGDVVVAWFGLFVICAHAIFSSYIKFAVNAWYTTFYDLLQTSGGTFGMVANATSVNGSSAATSHVLSRLESRQQVWKQLMAFGKIVLPAVFIHPAAKWVRSQWALKWRVCLMRAYIAAWDANQPPIEGASQRLHEDTQRFAKGLEIFLADILGAICTLAAFTPILLSIGAKVSAPTYLPGAQALGTLWIFGTALLAALVGLGVAMIAGRELVELEVANQKVEAELRRELVILETNPSAVCGDPARSTRSGDNGDAAAFIGENPPLSVATATPGVDGVGWLPSPAGYFEYLWAAVRSNYRALYRNFFYLNLWLTAFDQLMIVAPYLIIAPMLFADDASQRITLGTLVQTSNSFSKVFTSLSVVSENWGQVNEWRSVYVRLRQFESELFGPKDGSRSGVQHAGACCSNRSSDDSGSGREDGPLLGQAAIKHPLDAGNGAGGAERRTSVRDLELLPVKAE